MLIKNLFYNIYNDSINRILDSLWKFLKNSFSFNSLSFDKTGQNLVFSDKSLCLAIQSVFIFEYFTVLWRRRTSSSKTKFLA